MDHTLAEQLFKWPPPVVRCPSCDGPAVAAFQGGGGTDHVFKARSRSTGEAQLGWLDTEEGICDAATLANISVRSMSAGAGAPSSSQHGISSILLYYMSHISVEAPSTPTFVCFCAHW